jgi:maleylacetoacetate isomerase
VTPLGITLYSRYQNSAGERVRIVLNLKGLDYEYVPVSSLAPGEYTRLNPQGLMPALAVDGAVVGQSMAILEYLEERWLRPAMLPGDAAARARARAFCHHIACDLHPLNNSRVRRFLAGEMGAGEAGVTEWYRHWIAVTFEALERMLAAGTRTRFCFGDAPGMADACLVPQMGNARRFDCDLAAYPRLREIDARCRALDAFARAAPEAMPDFPG